MFNVMKTVLMKRGLHDFIKYTELKEQHSAKYLIIYSFHFHFFCVCLLDLLAENPFQVQQWIYRRPHDLWRALMWVHDEVFITRRWMNRYNSKVDKNKNSWSFLIYLFELYLFASEQT